MDVRIGTTRGRLMAAVTKEAASHERRYQEG